MNIELRSILPKLTDKHLQRSYIPFLVGIAVYIFLLVLPPPTTFTEPFSKFHLGFFALSVVFFGLLFNKKGTLWNALSIAFVLVLFGIALIYKWQTAHYSGQILGGYFPLSDASGYYAGAQYLPTGSHINSFAGRRPFFIGFLSTIFSLTGNNLHISLAIIVALVTISVYLAAREIQSTSNSFGAAIFLMLCYWYYFPFSGTLMTESLGLCLGSLSLAFLLKATRGELNLKHFSYGLFSLTIALNVRPGAFFILPALLIWAGFLFFKSGRMRYALLILTSVIVTGMIANIFLNKTIGNPGVTTYSKYSEFLYGLATGGQGWQAIHLEHPEMTESEAIKLSINIIIKEPNLLIKGIAKSYGDYFAPVNGGFSFLRLIYVQNNTPDSILWGLLGIGLITAFIKRKEGNYGLILVSFIGFFLSLAAVPPTEADDMRIYAVTMPFIFYITSTSIVPVALVIKKLIKFQPEEESKAPIEVLKPFTIGILTICLLGPLAVMAVRQSPKYKNQPSCSSDEEKIYFRIGNQSSITIMQDDAIAESYMPNMRVSDFRNGVVSGPIYTFYPHLDKDLLSLTPGQTINLVTYLPPQGSNSEEFSGYLITNGQVLPSGFYAGCGIQLKDTTEVPWFNYRSTSNNQPAKTFLIPESIDLIRTVYGLIVLFMIFAIIIDNTAFKLMSWKKRFLSLCNIVIILFGILIYLHSNAVFPLSWQRTRLEMKEATFTEGYAYQVPLGISWMNQKTIGQPPVTIYEDGIPLENPNAKIYAVKHLGQGRFLVQSGYLYVSASDNSDPRANGRKYEIKWPTPIRGRYQFAIYSLSLIGIFIQIKYFTTATKQAKTTQMS